MTKYCAGKPQFTFTTGCIHLASLLACLPKNGGDQGSRPACPLQLTIYFFFLQSRQKSLLYHSTGPRLQHLLFLPYRAVAGVCGDGAQVLSSAFPRLVFECIKLF